MATINPIKFATPNGLEGILRLSAMISQEINLLLRDTGNLRNSPFMSYQGSINGSGSDTIRVRLAGLDGYDSMLPATSEISDESGNATALTIQSTDIVCARQYLIYQLSDLASMSHFGPSDVDPWRLASSIVGSYETRFAELTATAASSFATSKGANGDLFSVTALFEGIYQLEQADSGRGVPGPYAVVLAPKALSELQSSLRNETGNAIAQMASTAEMLKVKGRNYAGELFGVEVYRSSAVFGNGSSGYDNYMCGAGCFGFADGVPDMIPGAAMDFMRTAKVLVEFDRAAMSAQTSVVGHAYMGISIINDLKGCKILSAQ